MGFRTSAGTIVSLILLALLQGACSSSKKLSQPEASVTVHLPDTLAALPPSEINIPVKIYARPWLMMTDSMVPTEFVSDGWPAWLKPTCEFRYKYRFVRSAFTITCSANTIGIQLDGSYQVAGSRCFCTFDKPVSPWISGSCGFAPEPMRKVHMAISSRFNFTPDYRIQTSTRLDKLSTPDKCIVSVLSQDITRDILDSIRSSITGFCHTLDETAASLNYADYLRKTYSKDWQKRQVGPYGYVMINPETIRIGSLDLKKDTFNISLGLTCHPVFTSDKHDPSSTTPLPRLVMGNKGEGVNLYIQTDYEYGFISKMLRDSLKDKSFLFKERNIVIKDIELKGLGHHQVELRVDFEGSKKGRIYLRGTPVLDTAKQTLSIPDISYSLESKDLALKMAKTIFRGKIRRSLKGNSYLDIGALIKADLPAIDSQMNKNIMPNLSARGNIKKIRLIGLLAGEKSFQAQMQIMADLIVTQSGIPPLKGFSTAGNH